MTRLSKDAINESNGTTPLTRAERDFPPINRPIYRQTAPGVAQTA
jgi:hypothetical protein